MTAASNISMVPDAAGRLLVEVLPGSDAWTLPHHHLTRTWQINDLLADRYGVRTSLRECLGLLGPAGPDCHRVFLHELQEPPAADSGVVFRLPETLAGRPCATPDDRAALDLLAGSPAGRPPHATPWSMPGWFASATSWIDARLAEHGLRRTGPPVQRSASAWSCLLRVDCEDTVLYAKASSAPLAYEARLTKFLTGVFPRDVPVLLALDADRSLMLMQDMAPLPKTPDGFGEAVVRYASMQRALVGRRDELLASGCPDLSPARLPACYDELLADVDLLAIGDERGMSREQYDRLRAFSGRFRDICAEVDDLRLGDTLVNVDFWPGNVAATSRGTVFYDWAQSVISTPLASMRQFGLVCGQSSDEADRRAWPGVVERHLACWSDLYPMERLHRAYFEALPIAIVLGAMIWRMIVSGVVPSRRFEVIYPDPRQINFAVAAHLRRILRWTDSDESAPWNTIL